MRNGHRLRNPANGLLDDCGWDDCQKPGTTLYKVRIFEGTDPRTGGPVYSWKIFCSERHRQYYVHAPRSHTKLPPGFRLACT